MRDDTSDAIEALPLPLARIDGEGRVLAVNAAFAEVFGAAPAELIGLDLREIADEELRGTHEPRQIGDRWWRVAVHGDADPVATLIDVTPECAALKTVIEADAVRSRLLYDAEIGTWCYDPEAQAYHFSRELAFGHDARTTVDVATLEKVQHHDDIPVDRAIRERLTREGGAAEAELRVRGADGGWRHLRVLFRTGRRLPSGRFEMYGLSQNITEQAAARDEANAMAARLKLSLRAAKAGVFDYDFERRVFWVTPELQEMIGAEALDAATYHPDDWRKLLRLLEPQAEGEPEPVDVRLVHPDGQRWVRIYLQVERDGQGRRRRGVGLLIDIDEQKRQELALTEARRAAEAATEAKSNFLAAVSHEIRTPLNGVVGVLHLLKRESLSAEAAGMLEEALTCSDMLAQLINDVLDFSKMEAGKLDITPIPTDPHLVLNSVTALVQQQAHAKGLYLRRTVACEGAAAIDPVRLRQCLFNVIGNAVKFTEAGGVSIRLFYTDAADGRRLRCEVEDTGVGVPDHAKATLFDRFQQADTGASRRFGGAGLGLSITRSLVQMMGGDMGFDSRLGEGSTFWFEIAAPDAEQPAGAPARVEGALSGLRVLVVDDNRTNRLVASKMLEALAAQVETAESGQGALEAISRTDFDLVLMDVNMPGMDGLEATRRIRGLPAPAGETPIIALTADVMTHHQRAYQAAGMDGLVPKPFSPAQLLAEVARLAAGEPLPIEARAAGAAS